ncbi:MAG: PAS domain S-box protein, partial [Deltaproteobacteria bacterium]|nr:PAS domain S-box protein [Deltaproteobacteria bacterium]
DEDKEKSQLINELVELRRRVAELETGGGEALRQSEQRYREVVENANEAIAVAQDGRIKFLNRKAYELVGYSEREVGDKPFARFIHPEDRQNAVDLNLRRIRGEPVPNSYEFRILNKNGGH